MYNVVRSPNMQLAEIGFGERRMEHYASRRQAWVGELVDRCMTQKSTIMNA